ncbi:Calmodulin-binding protein 25 [Spatholobus suberectus]|nr:Calmodulin-binding protein 25 [Spatholobus suberectus]
MDSGNSGSISSSDEEYDSSHADPSFLNHLGSISQPQPSLVPSHPTMFDFSTSYLHALSQSHPNPNPNYHSLLNLDSQGPRSEPNCTHPESLPSATATTNQCLSGPQPLGHDNIINAPPPNNNLLRNSKKRSRASRRAPTTVLTTDPTNFRSMVQEFTGIPAPPFSPPSLAAQTLCFQLRGPCYTTTTPSVFLLIVTTNYFPIYLYPISHHHRTSCKTTLFPRSTLLFTLLSLQGSVRIWWVLMERWVMNTRLPRACF